MNKRILRAAATLIAAFALAFGSVACSDGEDPTSVVQTETITLLANTTTSTESTVTISIAFANFSAAPTSVDVYAEGAATPIQTGVAVSGGKITLDLSSLADDTYKIYVKSGDVTSNSVSITLSANAEKITISVAGAGITDKAASAVYHFKQSVDGTAYDYAESETKTVAQGSTLSDVTKTYTGFTAQGLFLAEQPDGSYYVQVYYTRNIITVTLNGNGGTIGGKETTTQSGFYGTTFPAAKTLSIAHETKGFGGWNTKSDGTGTAYDDAGFTYSDTLTLYAQWLDFYEVTATEAAAQIESLASGSYTVKVTGAITDTILSDIKTALLTDTARYIALDLSGTTGLTELGDEAFTAKVNYTYTGTPIISLILPESVMKIGKYCFYNCKQLESVTAPGVTTLDTGAFYVCSKLTEVTFADEMESIGGLAFGYCESLTELTLNAKTIGNNVIADAKKLTILTLGALVETIANGAIQDDASALTTIIVAEGNTHFKVVDGILYSADGTRLVHCPAALDIPEITLANTVTTMDSYAFAGCKNLTSVTVPNVEKISSQAFLSCPALTTVSIPKATEIGGMAFYKCTKLADISLPDTVTSIGNHAFAYATALDSLFIPSSVTTMGYDVFNNWTENQTINCAASSKPDGWNENWSRYSYSESAKATITWSATR